MSTREAALTTAAANNIPNIDVALDAIQSLVEFHGGRTDAAALKLIRKALAPTR